AGELARQRRRHLFAFRLRRVPFVAALEAFAEVSARLGEFHLRAEIAALGTLLRDRLVPDDEVAVVVGAGVERGAALLRAPLDDLAAVLGAKDPGGHRARSATLWKGAAAEELPAAAVPDHYRLAADVTH